MRLALLILTLCMVQIRANAHSDWHSFIWEYDQVTPERPKERVALTLPAEFDGYPCTVQLDTGMNGAFQWHGDEKGRSTRIKFEVAGVVKEYIVGEEHLEQIRKGDCDSIASVGNAFFEKGSLILDLRNTRYKFELAAVLASSPKAQPLIYAQWYEVGGHLLVEVRVPSGEIKYAMLDTGAASFGLSPLSVSAWADLVGEPPIASPSVVEYKVNSWGKQISCFETERRGRLVIGLQHELKTFRVSYCQHPDFSTKQKLAGLLGLRDLMGSVITLDYRSRRWTVDD